MPSHMLFLAPFPLSLPSWFLRLHPGYLCGILLAPLQASQMDAPISLLPQKPTCNLEYHWGGGWPPWSEFGGATLWFTVSQHMGWNARQPRTAPS